MRLGFVLTYTNLAACFYPLLILIVSLKHLPYNPHTECAQNGSDERREEGYYGR